MSINDFTPRQLNASNFADRWQPRPDAHSKARGEQRYPTDELDWPGLLHGRIFSVIEFRLGCSNCRSFNLAPFLFEKLLTVLEGADFFFSKLLKSL